MDCFELRNGMLLVDMLSEDLGAIGSELKWRMLALEESSGVVEPGLSLWFLVRDPPDDVSKGLDSDEEYPLETGCDEFDASAWITTRLVSLNNKLIEYQDDPMRSTIRDFRLVFRCGLRRPLSPEAFDRIVHFS